MLDTITPLLEGKFSHDLKSNMKHEHPIFSITTSYREWVQQFASFLISRTSGDSAKTIFSSFRLAVRSQDAEVARFLVPHLVLNVLISGTSDDRQKIRDEIISVLEFEGLGDQGDRQLLSAEVREPFSEHCSGRLPGFTFRLSSI
jgi:serine/threonine-protein kinase ATR